MVYVPDARKIINFCTKHGRNSFNRCSIIPGVCVEVHVVVHVVVCVVVGVVVSTPWMFCGFSYKC